jgi:hypothetical protein
MVDSKAQTAVVQKAAEATAKIQKTKADELNEIEKAITENDVGKAKEKGIQFATTMQGDFEIYGAKDKAEKAKGIKVEIEKFDPKAKGSLKEKVGELTQLYVDLQKESVAYQLKGFTSLDLPLGWTADCKKLTSEWNEGSTVGQKILIILKKVGGLLMTAFLITFGAPFWNDILSALMGVKNLTSKKK